MSRLLHIVLVGFLFAVMSNAYAATYTLAGGSNIGDSLGNDDVLVVYVNGTQVASAGCCNQPPVTFNANPGDTLRVTVTDTQPDCHGVNPLYLFDSQGKATVLDAVGVPSTCPGGPVGLFYDNTFTVPGHPTIPTLSEQGMIILSCLLALGAVFTLRHRRQ